MLLANATPVRVPWVTASWGFRFGHCWRASERCLTLAHVSNKAMEPTRRDPPTRGPWLAVAGWWPWRGGSEARSIWIHVSDTKSLGGSSRTEENEAKKRAKREFKKKAEEESGKLYITYLFKSSDVTSPQFHQAPETVLSICVQHKSIYPLGLSKM